MELSLGYPARHHSGRRSSIRSDCRDSHPQNAENEALYSVTGIVSLLIRSHQTGIIPLVPRTLPARFSEFKWIDSVFGLESLRKPA